MSVSELTDAEAERLYRAWERRARWHLAQCPTVVRVLREGVMPSPVHVSDGDRVSGSGDESPLPFRADPLVDADLLWGVLGEYVEEVATKLSVRVPDALSEASAGNHSGNGFSARIEPYSASEAVASVCRWVGDRLDVIYLLRLDEPEDYLFGMIRRMRARYVIPVSERTPRRQCTLCGEWKVTAQWVNTVSKPVLVVACSHCGFVYRERDTADVPGGRVEGETLSVGDQTLAASGDADGLGPRDAGGGRDGAAGVAAPEAASRPDTEAVADSRGRFNDEGDK